MRVGIAPHYKHFLKDPLWPAFLTHSAVLLIDSWPHTRHKAEHIPSCHFNKAGSCQTQANSHKGFVSTETCFHKNQDPHKALLWPGPSFVAKRQMLDHWAPSWVSCPQLLPVSCFWQAPAPTTSQLHRMEGVWMGFPPTSPVFWSSHLPTLLWRKGIRMTCVGMEPFLRDWEDVFLFSACTPWQKSQLLLEMT